MTVEYDLSWGDPNERLYDIEIRFVAPADQPRLLLPVWRPGRYLIQNFAANVRQWSGSAAVWKDGKSSWRIAAREGDRVTMRYRCYAGTLDAGSSFLDSDEAYFNPSNILMMVEGLRDHPATLSLRTPAGWRVETQLPIVASEPAGTDTRHVLQARDYDHLIDSPAIAAASMAHHVFDEGGATFHLVFRGDEAIDTAQYVEPVRAIVRAQAALFGGLPLREYRFLFHVRDRWHGVEHEESCSIVVRRDDLLGAKPGDEGYDHLLSIVSHELFHVWNVKRIVPAVFSPYDYWVETPTRLLWAMEGLTSYFGDLSLLRAGIWDEERYLRHLAKEISAFESSGARLHLSLSQASFDGWLQDPSRPHDKGNQWYSFYNKGEIVGALLDLALLVRSGKSLDDVMRSMWVEYGEPRRGLDEDGVRSAVLMVGGDGFAEFFDRYVDGVEPLPYEKLFGAAGITVETRERPTSIGAKLRVADGAVLVDSVGAGGTAMAAGLLPDDELIAIGSTRVRSSDGVARVFRALGEGSTVEITIARAGIVERIAGVVKADPAAEITLVIDQPENPLRRQWLRRME